MSSTAAAIDGVLAFWFGTPGSGDDDYQSRRTVWFRKDPKLDQAIRDRFQDLYTQAASGALDDWQATPRGTVALLVVLDQFPRNMFRHDPRAFATDEKAREVAKRAIAHQVDQQLPPLQRLFIYMPLEHSEDLADQHQSVHLFEQLVEECPDLTDAYDYAVRHKAVIESFERFPHRNAILGRSTTDAEADFLKQPGSSF